MMNRTLSIRRKDTGSHRFSMNTFRGVQAPELSKRMTRMIKQENSAISAHETAGRERITIAGQLSEWGDNTEDDAVSDISDKLGVLMAEVGEQEDNFAQNLEDYRNVLKQIRDTEASVQPSRDQRAKITDEIQRLKLKEQNHAKVEVLEQELVRAEANNLVAEAQLTNVTRQKLKEAYDIHLAALIERGEKQILLAQHARRLLNYLDDSPVVPGDAKQPYQHAEQAKQILEAAEKDLKSWEPTSIEPIHTAAGETSGTTFLPTGAGRSQESQTGSSAQPETNGVATSKGYGHANGIASHTNGTATEDEVNSAKQQNSAHVSGAIGSQPVAVPY